MARGEISRSDDMTDDVADGAPTQRQRLQMPKQTHGSASADDLQRAARFRTELRRFLHATAATATKEGLTPERYDLLLMIEAATAAGEPPTVTSLIDTLDLRQQAVTELVKRAIAAGLVAREASDQDGRVSTFGSPARAKLA